MRINVKGALLSLTLLASGCAKLIKGTSQTVTITMIPAEFSTVGDRDAFFDRMRDTPTRESL